jgi:two-component system, cell cycle sensor histidine kinase and response regulator CckA
VASILVVEDDEQVRVGRVLSGGRGASYALRQHRRKGDSPIAGGAKVDLLFVDITLHGDIHGGLTLAQRVVEARPDLKVLYTTGRGITDGMRALFVQRAAFLPKPFSVDLLKKTLFMNFEMRSPGAN